MIGFRLYKKTIIKRDILTVSIAFVLLFLSAIYMDSRNASSSLDGIYSHNLGNDLLFIFFGSMISLVIAYMLVYKLGLFCGSLFDVCCIKYYLSDTLDNHVEHSDNDYLNAVYSGEIPFIDDEYVEELDYTVRYVKVNLKEYNNIESMIYNKKCTEEQKRMAKLRKQYESGYVPKIFLGK